MYNQFGGTVKNLLKNIFVSKTFVTDNKKPPDTMKTNSDQIHQIKQFNKTINENVPVYQISTEEPYKIKKMYNKVPTLHVTKINNDFEEYKLAYDVDLNALVPVSLKNKNSSN